MIAMSDERRTCTIVYIFLLLVGVVVGISSCTNLDNTLHVKKFRIGFSQCTGDNKWRNATLDGVKRELSFHPGTELIYKNAEDNSALQVQQIKELSTQNIDILLVSPNEAEPLTSIIEEIYNKGIPVVIIDRKINSDMYTAFVGADNFEIGRMAGNYVLNLYTPHSKVIEIIGLKGSTPSIERKNGFAKSLETNTRIPAVTQVYGNWLKNTSEEELMKIKGQLSPNDIVFAQNDPMALGAYEVYKKLGLLKTAKFIGVDALGGPGGGINLVSEKKLKATLLNPPGGEEAIQIAFKILNKEQFDKENTLSTVVIDSTNVRIMQLQTNKINIQQKDIEHQQDLLMRQQKVYENQNTVINIFIGAMILVLTLSAVSIYALWNNRKITRRLSVQNQEILYQRNQLIEMTAKAKEATDAKFNFFTNISHEFRTPLTLILGPVEDSLFSSKLHFTLKNNLLLVHKNTMRLLRLVNQLMDYRKIEESRMKLKVSENDLVPFVSEITDAFQEMARKKSILFKVHARIKTLPVWFDVNMLDKVLFNLLSNAFKFTKDNDGVINVTIDKTEDDTMAIIKVEDSGIGMHPEEIDHAFELFYQGNTTHSKGTGLGLSLSKELVSLHHGKIVLKSEKWKGTTFEVYLPIGKNHFEAADFTLSGETRSLSYEDIKIYTKEEGQAVLNAEYNPSTGDKQHSILIIEDNDDLRLFLKSRLSELYDVHEAGNGKSGLHLAYDIVPDLIISDIILPGNDGLYITEMIKQDIRTSHIPLILLTAKNSMEEQIKGIRLQADAFIVKPFNLEFLTETIKNLLKSRAVLREHYTSELPSEARANNSKKIDRKFINEFTAIVEGNVANESFSVEDICREIGISRVQLYRKVKALLDYNVNDYILTVRMQKGKYLLAHENLSIFEVACKVGFSSQAYFATVFKSKFSVTPTEYRESKKQ
jgi:signal transduction histidine kinase/DNA-binding response OmpR family regulator/cellobiose-specific phosphotransferase system component IIB